jgi:hypothetical protein
MAQTKGNGVYVATETFACEVDGEPIMVHKGVTRVRSGHALLKGNAEKFEPVDLHVEFDVEAASAAPGEKRAR